MAVTSLTLDVDSRLDADDHVLGQDVRASLSSQGASWLPNPIPCPFGEGGILRPRNPPRGGNR